VARHKQSSCISTSKVGLLSGGQRQALSLLMATAGEQRAAMNVSDLLRLFRRDQGEELTDDALLLS
jgi:ABC-type uncharacterized transport system ATPase component